MIHCKIEERAGILLAIESTGHGLADGPGGASVSCAAVSALVRSAGAVLEKRRDVLVRVEGFEPGRVGLRIVEAAADAECWLRGVTDMLVQGIGDVQRDFPDQIEFELIQIKD